MTPKEFSRALESLGLSQLETARQLGVDGRTVRYWIAGARPIPGPATACIDAWLLLGAGRRCAGCGGEFPPDAPPICYCDECNPVTT